MTPSGTYLQECRSLVRPIIGRPPSFLTCPCHIFGIRMPPVPSFCEVSDVFSCVPEATTGSILGATGIISATSTPSFHHPFFSTDDLPSRRPPHPPSHSVPVCTTLTNLLAFLLLAVVSIGHPRNIRHAIALLLCSIGQHHGIPRYNERSLYPLHTLHCVVP